MQPVKQMLHILLEMVDLTSQRTEIGMTQPAPWNPGYLRALIPDFSPASHLDLLYQLRAEPIIYGRPVTVALSSPGIQQPQQDLPCLP